MRVKVRDSFRFKPKEELKTNVMARSYNFLQTLSDSTLFKI